MRKSYSDRLFVINQKKGILEINKDELREIKEFRVILERDKGGKVLGDHDGRKKYFARKELYYIYIMADPFNMYSILNDARRHKRALEETGLISIEGWKPDKAVKEAIVEYIAGMHELSPVAKAYLNSKKALDNIGDDIALLNDYSNELREKIRIARICTEDEDRFEDDKQQASKALGGLMDKLSINNKEVFNLTSTLPDRMEALEKLKTKLSKEDTERDEVIGGGGTFRREDPDK